ncbi:MAG: hypothetical protein JSR73_02825 [Proteobacteria bacterium]|nr:hypothetical protein [Pseudomonadota bacterium]
MRSPFHSYLAAMVTAAAFLGASAAAVAQALPFLAPGDSRLRHMVSLEADTNEGLLQTTWPLPTAALADDERDKLRGYDQPGSASDAGWFLSAAEKPSLLRTFSDTPREQGEAGVQAGWAAGDYAGGAFRISYAVRPQDGMHFRFDGTYVAWRYSNWWVSVGLQDRWWGPGWDGSLILSNNARPMPGIGIERASMKPFETRWLSWLGPWHFVTFLNHMENHRPDFNNTLFWGARFTAAPARGLEIGLSRTAEFCGQGHSCGLGTFWDMLIAKSNREINPTVDNNPDQAHLLARKQSAQVMATDVRWHVGSTPFSVYWQQLGEVFDDHNLRPRQTLQLFGLEFASWGTAEGRARTFLEFADTACGSVSFSSTDTPNYGCAYEKDTWRAGYRYYGRVIGDSMDRDGRRITLGGVLIDRQQRSWELRFRHFDLNRGNIAEVGLLPQTVATTHERLWNTELQVSGQVHSLRYSIGAGADYGGPVDSTKRLTGRGFLNLSKNW